MMEPSPCDDPKSLSLWRRLRNTLPTLSRSEQAAVFNQMRNNSRAGVDFYVMMLLSVAIATFGLLQNSVAVIIGAMLVAPLMSPMIAIGHSIVMGNIRLFQRAVISTTSGVVVAVVTATLMTLTLPSLDMLPTSDEILARTRPNLLDQYVALVSGAAAAYAMSRKGVAAAMPGVAIAAALVPPLCVVGFGLGTQQWLLAAGALLLFFTNLVAIVFASAAVFTLLGFRPSRVERNEQQRRGAILAIIGMIAITVPLVFSTLAQLERYKTRVLVKQTLEDVIPPHSARIENLRIELLDNKTVIYFTAYQLAHRGDETERAQSRRKIMNKLQRVLEHKLTQQVSVEALIVEASLERR